MAEHGRPYDESGCDLADYSRLPEACEQRAQGMRNDHQCSERQQNMCDVRCFKWHVRNSSPGADTCRTRVQARWCTRHLVIRGLAVSDGAPWHGGEGCGRTARPQRRAVTPCGSRYGSFYRTAALGDTVVTLRRAPAGLCAVRIPPSPCAPLAWPPWIHPATAVA